MLKASIGKNYLIGLVFENCYLFESIFGEKRHPKGDVCAKILTYVVAVHGSGVKNFV